MLLAGLRLSAGATSTTPACRKPTTSTSPSTTTTTLPTGGFRSGIITNPSTVFSEPDLPRPAYFQRITPAPLNVPIMRITNDTGASTAPVSGVWGSDARHVYAKQQPWNADESLIWIENRDGGSPTKLLLDGSTYTPVGRFCSAYQYYDFRWHPQVAHRNEQINIDSSGTELMWFDVLSCTKTRSWPLPIAAYYGIGSGEGNPSNDGRFVAINGTTQIYVVDMDPQPPFAPYPSQRIGPARTVSSCGLSDCTVDWVSISSSGTYVVAHYAGDNNQVFDVNPSTLALTPRALPSSSYRCAGTAGAGFLYSQGHADLARNPFDNNEDVLIGQDACHISGNTITALKPDGTTGSVLVSHIMMVRLRDGAILPLTNPSNEAYAHHVSTRNLNRPGWVYVDYFQIDGQRFTDEVIAVKMDGSQAVQRFAHKRSFFGDDQCMGGGAPYPCCTGAAAGVCGCYRCESHAVPSMDGRRMLFASNWAVKCDSGCGLTTDIKDYVIDARP